MPVSCDHVTNLIMMTITLPWCRPYVLMSSEQYYDWQYLPSKRETGEGGGDLFCVVLLVSLFVFFSVFFVVYFFAGVILLFSSGWNGWNRFYHYNISGRGEILSYNGLRQMELNSLEWDLKSEICQGISDYKFHCGVSLYLYSALFLTRGVEF